jgi:hypothetical protein
MGPARAGLERRRRKSLSPTRQPSSAAPSQRLRTAPRAGLPHCAVSAMTPQASRIVPRCRRPPALPVPRAAPLLACSAEPPSATSTTPPLASRIASRRATAGLPRQALSRDAARHLKALEGIEIDWKRGASSAPAAAVAAAGRTSTASARCASRLLRTALTTRRSTECRSSMFSYTSCRLPPPCERPMSSSPLDGGIACP